MKHTLILLLALLVIPSAYAEEKQDIDYMPKVHGAFRARFENEFSSGLNRFQMRNARISLDGQVASAISYFVQIDACDCGKMKFLDAYGQIDIISGLNFRMGQFREPFGLETFRAPANYIFSNRSFLGKTVCNIRGVGVRFGYTLPQLPLTFEAGGFNTSGIADHTTPNKQLAFASRIIYKPSAFTLATGYMSQSPYGKRVSLYDLAFGYTSRTWEFLSEGIVKTYTSSALDPTWSYAVWGCRYFPVKWGVFNRVSVQARFDGMTDLSSGLLDENRDFEITSQACNRLTLGATVTHTYKKIHADLRLDVEKYFYHSGAVIPAGADSKIVAELIIRF